MVGVSLGHDGIEIKPSLELDRNKLGLVRSSKRIDKTFIMKNPIPNPQELKESMHTSAEIAVTTTVDNCVCLADGADYVVSRESGNDVAKQVIASVKGHQTCLCCLEDEAKNTGKVIHQQDTIDNCNSKCDKCFTDQIVCGDCATKGHTSIHPQLRACSKCILRGTPCFKFAVIVSISDWEEKN